VNQKSAYQKLRSQEILQHIQAKRREEAAAPAQASLSAALDSLNALGFLDEAARKGLPGMTCFGPRAFWGLAELDGAPRHWMGAALWYKGRGYYHYDRLWLLGIWAYGDPAAIVLGVKELAFKAPFYNAESYFYQMQRGFDLYYAGDGSPDGAAPRYTAAYDPARRLAIRGDLQAELIRWARGE
jgi:hypothetical protein